MKLLKDLVLVQLDKEKEVTKSGLVLSEKPKPNEGTVVAVGGEAVSLSMGDRVMFSVYAGQDIGSDQRIMKEDEVYGILEEESI